jgi:transcriptional regulator with XRE-family HTH domain
MPIDEIGTAVRNARRGLKITQEELASIAYVGRQTIARLETGRSNEIGYKSLLRILNAVGLDLRLTTLNQGRPTLEDLAQDVQT